MSNLPTNKVNQAYQLTIDSREIADMLEIKHKEILRKLEGAKDRKGYIQILTEHQMVPSDYFIPSTYKDESGKENKCYLFTKLGCEFIANKFTGEKGVLFTAKYVKRFNEMEQSIKTGNKSIPEIKQKEIEARLRNAKVRQANILLKIAANPDIPSTYRQVLYSYAAWAATGKQILPLPEAKQHTYSAEEIGQMLNISANMVGRIANKLNLKTSEFGEYVWDKAKHVDKQIATFRYYVDAIEKIREYLNLQSDK